MNHLAPLVLAPTIQPYAWGKEPPCIISNLVKSEGSAQNIEVPEKCAELWMGAHPSAPAKVLLSDGSTARLDELITKNAQELLGASTVQKFGKALPFLFKVLSIAKPLSIQAHPDKTLATILHQANPKEYPDTNHKPEIAIALTELHVLYGFKPLKEIAALLVQYPEIKKLLSGRTIELIQKNQSVLAAAEATKLLFTELMSCSADLYGQTMRLLVKKPLKNGFERYFIHAFEEYGAQDRGLICFFIMNSIVVQQGKGIYIGANIPHAYLSGDLIECMANSDNVLRAGLTKKFQDKATLLRILDYSQTSPKIITPTLLHQSPHVEFFEVPVQEFKIARINSATLASYQVQVTGAEIILCLEGRGRLVKNIDGKSIFCQDFQKGSVLFIPAAVESYQLELEGVCFKVSC